MQVGLATNQLKTNAPYMTTAYGFSVFAILGPLIPGGAILIALVILVVINWKFQKRNQQSVSSASTILKIEMFSLVCARSRGSNSESQHNACAVCVQVWEKKINMMQSSYSQSVTF